MKQYIFLFLAGGLFLLIFVFFRMYDSKHAHSVTCYSNYCDISVQSGVAKHVGYGRGAAMVDVNTDGWVDIWDADAGTYESDIGNHSTIFINDTDGTFSPLETGIAPEHLSQNWSGSFADYDNDGDPDLLLVNGGYEGTGHLHLYRNDLDTEEQRFVNVTETSNIVTDELSWWGASWADINNDGFLDFVANPVIGSPVVFMSQSGTSFTEVSHTLGIIPIFTDGKNPVWLDFDADNDQDLFLAGTDAHFLYRNDGERFTDVTSILKSPLLENTNLYTFSALSTDINQDGYEDLYLGRWTRQDIIFFGNNDGTLTAATSSGINTANLPHRHENTMGLGVGDINTDGLPDLMLGTGNPRDAFTDLIYCNVSDINAHVFFERCENFYTLGHDKTRTHGIVTGDIDNDGDYDIFYNTGGPSKYSIRVVSDVGDTRTRNALYRFDGEPGSIANITLVGSSSNRDAIGATLVMHSEPPRYFTVRSTQGFQSQNSKRILVPLPETSSVPATVHWPSGHTQEVTVRPGEQIITERS